MKVVGILPELLVVEAGKEGRRRGKDRTIERGDKSPKRLLITLTKIQAGESMTYLSGIIRDNSAKATIKTPLLKSFIKFALISSVIIIIKPISGLLSSLASD